MRRPAAAVCMTAWVRPADGAVGCRRRATTHFLPRATRRSGRPRKRPAACLSWWMRQGSSAAPWGTRRRVRPTVAAIGVGAFSATPVSVVLSCAAWPRPVTGGRTQPSEAARVAEMRPCPLLLDQNGPRRATNGVVDATSHRRPPLNTSAAGVARKGRDRDPTALRPDRTATRPLPRANSCSPSAPGDWP